MKYLVVMCLWWCVACKSTVRAPVSGLHAITDGRVTLGVVASENEEGLQVYRLLLCKRFSVYDAATFADRTKCLPAMLDGDGREVVIFHNSLRRSFAAKYGNYAKIVAGVALVAGAVYGVHRWFAKGSKYIDNLASRADEALQIKKSELQEAYDEEIADIVERLHKLEANTDESEKLLGELRESRASPGELEKVLVRIEGIDAKLGESLRINEERWRVRFAQIIGAEELDNLAKRVAKSDEIFSRRIEHEKFILQPITNTDLHYFGNFYRDATQLFDREIREKLTRVANRDPSLIVNELSHTEKVIIAMRIRKAYNFAQVAMMRQYEMEKELLLQLSEGRLSVAEMKKNLQNLTANESLDVESYIELVEKFDISTYFGRISSTDNHGINNAKFLLEYVNGEERLFEQALPTIEKIHEIAAHREAIRMYEMEGFKLESALATVDSNMKGKYERLYQRETSQVVSRGANESSFWDNIMKIKGTDTAELQIESLKKEIDIFEANLRIRTADYEQLTSQIKANEALKELLIEHRDNTVQRLREAVQAMEDGNTARVQELKQVAEKERQAWGLSGLAAGLGATAMLTSLDKSIWGHGEKQLGEYWSQIFSDKESFADAASVKDMPAVLNKLAEVFGHRVNAAALQLAQ